LSPKRIDLVGMFNSMTLSTYEAFAVTERVGNQDSRAVVASMDEERASSLPVAAPVDAVTAVRTALSSVQTSENAVALEANKMTTQAKMVGCLI